MILLGFVAAVAASAGVRGAELPTIRRAPAEHNKACDIDGMKGYLIPGSETCLKVSGYISGGIGMGNLRQQSGGPAPSH
jgi:hypothetical protein